MIYYYKMIKQIGNNRILFNDDHMLNFSDCNRTWRNIHKSNGICIGERDVTANPPFFGFYENEEKYIKVIITGFFKDKKFHFLKREIEKYGYSTYDLS